MCLLAAIPMSAVGRVSASVMSRRRGEAFQCFQSGRSSLSVKSSDILKLLHASPATAFCLAAGASFKVNFSNHRI